MKAFPNPTLADTQNNSSERLNNPDEYGMNLRDYFAAKAMQGVLSDREQFTVSVHDARKRLKNTNETVTELAIELELAKNAYLMADAMMEARK